MTHTNHLRHLLCTLLTVGPLTLAPGAAHAQTAPAPARAPQTQRVQFGRGGTSTEVRDVIVGYAEHDFVLRASAGQQLSIRVNHPELERNVEVLGPPGREGGAPWVMTRTLDERGAWSGRLLETGDYTVRVRSYRAEPITYDLAVSVRGAARQPAAAARDAHPAGTYFGPDGSILIVRDAPGDVPQFELEACWRGTNTVHTGEAAGPLMFRGSTARNVDRTCRLAFRFGGDHVYVTQESSGVECDFGANVEATGVYRRAPEMAAIPLRGRRVIASRATSTR